MACRYEYSFFFWASPRCGSYYPCLSALFFFRLLAPNRKSLDPSAWIAIAVVFFNPGCQQSISLATKPSLAHCLLMVYSPSTAAATLRPPTNSRKHAGILLTVKCARLCFAECVEQDATIAVEGGGWRKVAKLSSTAECSSSPSPHHLPNEGMARRALLSGGCGVPCDCDESHHTLWVALYQATQKVGVVEGC